MARPNITLERFDTTHFKEYKSWFAHPSISKHLGNIDEEWLDYIINDQLGIDLAGMLSNQLIGVCGIVYPTTQDPYYAISNLAIKPELQNQGLGSVFLACCMDCFHLKPGVFWSTFVHQNNLIAFHFFQKNGWVRLDGIDQEMIQWVYHP